MNTITHLTALLEKRFPFLCLIFFLLVISFRVESEEACNPLITPESSDTTLQSTLSRLANQYDFKLSLPLSLDRPVKLRKSMNLDQLVKYLTRDMNTVLKHKKVKNCAKPVLTHLIVLPVGKEAEYVSVAQSASADPEDFIYIDDMELYVGNVLSGSQKADVRRMTPEQREDFERVHTRMRQQLAEEIDQEKQLTETNPDSLEGNNNAGNEAVNN